MCNERRGEAEERRQREHEADADLEAGRHTTYDDVEAFLDSLPE